MRAEGGNVFHKSPETFPPDMEKLGFGKQAVENQALW